MNRLSHARWFGLLITLLSAMTLPRQSSSAWAPEVLFDGRFTRLDTDWEAVELEDAGPVPVANRKSRWIAGLAEFSGIENADNHDLATALLAGDTNDINYAMEASVFSGLRPRGDLTGFVFAYQNATHFYHVGYNFVEGAYQLKRCGDQGFETLAEKRDALPERKQMAWRLEFISPHIRFVVDDQDIFSIEDRTYARGRFGLGTSALGNAAFLFQKVSVRAIDSGSKELAQGAPAAPASRVLLEDDFTTSDLHQWQTWDSPTGAPKKSAWRVVLSEYSGTRNTMEQAAALLLAGKQPWQDCTIRTDLLSARDDGNLTGIVFGYQDAEHFYHVGYNFAHNRFELQARTPAGFELLALAEQDYPDAPGLLLELTTAGGKIVMRAGGTTLFDIAHFVPSGRVGLGTSALDDGEVALSGFQILRADPSALPARQAQDLLAYHRGASIIYHVSDSADAELPNLIDHSLTDAEDLGGDFATEAEKTKLPESVVFAFPQGRFVEIQRVGIRLAEDSFPQTIRCSVSLQSPKSGFQPLGTFAIKPQAESYQEFPVAATRAKYFKLEIVQASEPEICISELFVSGLLQELAISNEEALPPEAELKEAESNGTLDQAQLLPLEKTLAGEVAQQDDDYYKIAPAPDSAQTLTIEIAHAGILKPKCTLLRSNGTAVEPREALNYSRGISRMIYAVEPPGYTLHIVRPQTYLAIVFDDSSSMGDSVPIVKRVLRGYLDQLGSELAVQLLKYADAPTELCDFTNMPNKLSAALEGQVGGGGSTETLLGLEAAVDSVAAKSGNRAVLAIFDVVDTDEGNEGYQRLWDKVLDNGIIFSTIGVKSGWEERSEFYGNSRQEIFRELAYATGGQLHHSPSDEFVAVYAEQFFNGLTAPLEYQVRATWPAAPKSEAPAIPTTSLPPSTGRLSVRYAADAAAQRIAPALELVLDSSNSMSETVARVPKHQIARNVVKSVLADLPRETHIGLRLYGHRGVWMARDQDPQAPALAANDTRLNEDSQLVVPIGPLTDKHRKEIDRWLERAKPNGKTPLVYSLLQALGDFSGDAQMPRVVVLVSDGKENCGGKLSDLAVAYRKAGANAAIHVIGFDLKRDQEAKRQLGAIARLGSGVYFDARDAGELATALQATVRATSFEVLDPITRRRISAGIVEGPPLTLPEGKYTVRLIATQSSDFAVQLARGKTVELKLDRSGSLKPANAPQ